MGVSFVESAAVAAVFSAAGASGAGGASVCFFAFSGAGAGGASGFAGFARVLFFAVWSGGGVFSDGNEAVVADFLKAWQTSAFTLLFALAGVVVSAFTVFAGVGSAGCLPLTLAAGASLGVVAFLGEVFPSLALLFAFAFAFARTDDLAVGLLFLSSGVSRALRS